MSKIEWTEATWNPLTGCNKISDGCANCYAELLAKRLRAMGNKRYTRGFELTLHPDLLTAPYHWKRPRIVFVNSMSDLFHEGVPFRFIEAVFRTMNETPRHIYQILTKRSERLQDVAGALMWSKNIWMGVTIESQQYAYRFEHLAGTPAATKFISFEPLLSAIDFDFSTADWAIVGGESGPKARPMNPAWVRGIQRFCQDNSIPFFFKQWGGTNKKKAGRLLDGKTWDEYPPIRNLRLTLP